MDVKELVELCVKNGITVDMAVVAKLKYDGEVNLLDEYKRICKDLRGHFLTQNEFEYSLSIGLIHKVGNRFVVGVNYDKIFITNDMATQFWEAYPPTTKIQGKVVSLLGIDKSMFDIMYQKRITSLALHQTLLHAVEYGKSINFQFPKITNFVLQETWKVIAAPDEEVTYNTEGDV